MKDPLVFYSFRSCYKIGPDRKDWFKEKGGQGKD